MKIPVVNFTFTISMYIYIYIYTCIYIYMYNDYTCIRLFHMHLCCGLVVYRYRLNGVWSKGWTREEQTEFTVVNRSLAAWEEKYGAARCYRGFGVFSVRWYPKWVQLQDVENQWFHLENYLITNTGSPHLWLVGGFNQFSFSIIYGIILPID